MTQTTTPSQDVQEMVAQADTGARAPKGLPGRVLWFVPLCWSLFQLWYASPLPFIFDFGVLNDTQARSIHLTFAVFLAFTAYPAMKGSPRDRIPLTDWLLALAGSFSAAYIYLFYAELAGRSGAPTQFDVIASVVGMVLLLEATRRALGPPLMMVAALFLLYTFAGPYMPDVIAHKGASLNKAMSHLWAHHRRGIWCRTWGIYLIRVPVRAFWCHAGAGWRGRLLHQSGFLDAWAHAWWSSQSGRGSVRPFRIGFWLFNRQRGHHGNFHHSFNETCRLSRHQSGCSGSSRLHQRPTNPTDYGRSSFFNGGICRDFLC
ncbi:putative membrane protein [Vibrio cholerae CP1047(20)]|nr:putative membrane protein [Vibrio cholerae CP1047(20)]